MGQATTDMGRVTMDMGRVTADGRGAAKLPCGQYKGQLIARPSLDEPPPLSVLFQQQAPALP